MHSAGISIWFFVGVLLTIYGAMILGYGIFSLITGSVSNVALANLHAPVWWGAMLTALGIFYLVKFRPGKTDR
ncbi:MAG: hypothetical protein ACRD3N_16300 [Terracidiphilus sp.]